MKAQLTDNLIKKHRDAGQRIELWDNIVPNFYVQVRTSGHASYYIRYTSPLTGQKRALKLGDATIWTADKARQLARTKLAQVDAGQDPAAERQALRTCPSLADVIEQHYLPHVKTTKTSWATDEVLLRCHVLPVLGTRRLSSITSEAIIAVLNGMRHGGKAGGPKGRSKTKQAKGQDYAAGTCNRLRVILRYLFNLAIHQWQIPGIKVNPIDSVPDYPDTHRQVFLRPDEIERLLEAGRPHPGAHNPHILWIVMLLVLTGVRRANALQAEWSEFDLARGLWNLPSHKTKQRKAQTIQLPQEALKLLVQLSTYGQGGPYLFPSPKTGKPFRTIYYSWNRMRQKAGLEHVRLHDLRHTFASLLINGGASLFMVQSALARIFHATTQIEVGGIA